MKQIKKIEEKIIKEVKILLRIRKSIDDVTIKNLRNLFRLKKEKYGTTVKDKINLSDWKRNKAFKNRIIRDIRNLLEHEVEDYYKPVRVGNFWSNSYIAYERNDDRCKTLSVG